MAFDWNQFGATFLSTISGGIEKKREDAEEYEQAQKEAAQRNQRTINARKAAANQAAQFGKRAKELMVDDPRAIQIIQNVMSSGPNAIATFYQKLEEQRNLMGTDKLSISDVEAVADISDVEALPTADMSMIDFALETYGAKTSQIAQQEDDTPLMGKLLGFNARDRADARLAKDMRYGDMSIADINLLASMEDYKSMPGFESSFITYKDAPVFTNSTFRDFKTDMNGLLYDYEKDNVALIQQEIEDVTTKLVNESNMSREDARARATQLRTAKTHKEVLISEIDAYAADFKEPYLKNEKVKEYIIEKLGEDFYNDLLQDYGLLEEDDEKEIIDAADPGVGGSEITSEAIDEAMENKDAIINKPSSQTVEPVEPRPSVGKGRGGVGATKEDLEDWDKKHKGKYNKDGTAIIVEPRPPKGTVITKAGYRPKDAYKEWMKENGDTHDPVTGNPLPVEEE